MKPLSRSPISLPLIPSFYGLCGWLPWVILYQQRLLSWDEPAPVAMWIFASQIIAFAMSTMLMRRSFRSAKPVAALEISPRFIAFCYALGTIGIAKYVFDFASSLGGIGGFLSILKQESYVIRWQSESLASFGTQITYVGWFAIAATLASPALRRRRIWLLAAAGEYLLNFLYVDRTRPTWILFAAGVLVMAWSRVNFTRLIVIALVLVVALSIIFFGVASWVGKVYHQNAYGLSALPPSVQLLYYYGTGGFAYFDAIIAFETPDYTFERTLYPILKLGSMTGAVQAPPSQINDFYFVPFPTNVGTALEPFYRDGGFLGVGFGIVIISIGVDLLALFFLRSRSAVAHFAWANLCYASLMSFFTPKLTTFPIWLFCFAALIAIMMRRLSATILPQQLDEPWPGYVRPGVGA